MSALALVLLAALLRHLDALQAPFFADDYLFLEQVRGHSLLGALASPDPIGNFLRPVSRPIYFWLMAHIGGETPAVFHAFNLGLFLGCVALLFWIVRRLAGNMAAGVAGCFLALHYASDVPILWGSGSQDLLMLAGSLGTIALYLRGNRLWAALLLGLALLSKETACLVPVVAAVVGAKPAERFKASLGRAWPLFAVAAAWIALWLATASSHLPAATLLQINPAAWPSAFIHLLQVSFGLEIGRSFPPTGELVVGLIAVGLAVTAVRLIQMQSPRSDSQPHNDNRFLVRCGLTWTVCGCLPMVAVVSIWSAYFYLFALCGVALCFGALIARLVPRHASALVAILGVTSIVASGSDGFALLPGPWRWQSHLNRSYIARANNATAHYLQELWKIYPRLPRNSTVFFAGLPAFTALQAGDGALLRYVYEDSSIQSHYLSEFSLEAVRRGPWYVLHVEGSGLRDHSNDPDLLRNLAYTMIVQSRPGPAADALTAHLERRPRDDQSRYWLAWTQWSLGDTALAARSLLRCGVSPTRGASPRLALAESTIAQGDTAKAIGMLFTARNEYGLDTEAHAQLAPYLLLDPSTRAAGVVEAFAVTALAPGRADGWRTLAIGQVLEKQYAPASASLERYLELGGREAREDKQVQRVMALLRRQLTTGEPIQVPPGD